MTAPLLVVQRLTIELRRRGGDTVLVDDVSFSVGRGETVGIVGESGSGKSLTALAILQVLPPTIHQSAGSVTFDGVDLSALRGRALRRFRRQHLGAIFQDPQVSLNPAFTIGNQLVETLRLAQPDLSKRAAAAEAAALLAGVGINRPRDRLSQYPYQLSGGMAQRVMIALAIAGKPTLLVADEPTTALDVTVQAQILELLASLRREHGLSLVLISHDLGVVGQVADRVVVFYAGQVVNEGPVPALLHSPRHPYTEALLASRPIANLKGRPLRVIPGMVPAAGTVLPGCRFAPRCAYATERCTLAMLPLVSDGAWAVRCVRSAELTLTAAVAEAVAPSIAAATPDGQSAAQRASAGAPLMEVRGLVKLYGRRPSVFARHRAAPISALSHVSFDVAPGETVGLVGESGAGKSTVGRIILGLTAATAGVVRFAGEELGSTTGHRSLAVRSQIQVVFQNPYATLDPLMTVGNSIREPLDTQAHLTPSQRIDRVVDLLVQVGFDGSLYSRFPAELSGGQRQRVAIARALAPSPRLIVCDEPVSSLDVSTQAQVINLLEEVQRQTGVAYVFIGHDLSIVHHVSDRIAVMYGGEIVELNEAGAVYTTPRHPYTRELLASRPGAAESPAAAGGSSGADAVHPAAAEPAATGCVFAPRCPHAWALCTEVSPPPYAAGVTGFVRCHLYGSDGKPAADPAPAPTLTAAAPSPNILRK